MPQKLTVVVAGVPALATALEDTGQFSQVFAVGSTSELRSLLASRSLSSVTGDKIFLFSDRTTVDTPQTLPTLASKLTGLQIPVVIVAVSPGARDLVAQCPGAGMLEGPLRLNQVLGAISGIRGMTPLTPVQDSRNVDIPLVESVTPGPAVAAAPQAPFPPSAPTFGTGPKVEPENSAAPATAPPVASTPPAPPAFPGGAPGFGAAAEKPQPVSPPTSPAAAAFPGGTPGFGAGSTHPQYPSPEPTSAMADPLVAANTPPSDSTPAVRSSPKSPFGGSAADPKSTSPFGGASGSPSSPFGAPPKRDTATAKPASPFGGPPSFGAGRSPLTTPPGASLGGAAHSSQRRSLVPSSTPVGHKGRVITVTAPKGGTGKSTLSLNLAAYLGLRLRGTGRTVCLIDANVQQADTGKYLNEYSPNIENVFKDPGAIDPDNITKYLLHKTDLNMSALLGPVTPDRANPEFYRGSQYAKVLEALKPNFDYILIDTPVAEFYHDIFRSFAIPCADFIAVAISPNMATLDNTDNWLRQIVKPENAGGMGFDRNNLGIVLNRAQTDIGLSEEYARAELGEWPWLGSVPETKEWQRCNNNHEIVAMKNYDDLNRAFSAVLARATGEELLLTTGSDLQTSAPRGGLLGRLLKGRK